MELVSAGRNRKHGICNLMFLPEPPTAKDISYKVTHTEAITLPGHPDEMTVSWITSWPSSTRFVFGTEGAFDQVVTADPHSLVHRVVLKGLKPKAIYQGRAVGAKPDGSLYQGKAFTFQLRAPLVLKTSAKVTSVPLQVKNHHPFPAVRQPITTGIPFPTGVLGSTQHVRLRCGGKPVPIQIETTARWPDHSIKWVLVTFPADVSANPADVSAKSTQVYHLEFGQDVTHREFDNSIARRQGDAIFIDTRKMQFKINAHGEVVIRDQPCRTVLRMKNGEVFSSENSNNATIEIEENGPLRTVIKTTAQLTSPQNATLFLIEKRIEAYAGQDFVRIFHTFTNNQQELFTSIEELTYDVPSMSDRGHWDIAMAGGDSLPLDSKQTRVSQRLDDQFVSDSGHSNASNEPNVSQGRIIGSAISVHPEAPSVALRDFWQNYPKSFESTPKRLKIGLCPEFEPGVYDDFPFEKEGHQLYYYLRNGHYQFKRGMSKTHELMISLASETRCEAQATFFQNPLLATAPPQWYCDSLAFYDVAPRNEKRFKAYEDAIDEDIVAYKETQERQHDFGLMNYGDWYGERGSNWGNSEYDTQHAFFLEYIRSGNPAAFFLGDATEKHNRDIDTLHWAEKASNVGAVYTHQMGHVGDYYKISVPGTKGFPRAGFSVSHAWVEGHFDHYFLTGDRRSFETGKAVADFFIRDKMSHPYHFTSCRVPGWHLIMNASAYAATGDPYYLNASRVIVQNVLETQDTLPNPLPPYQREQGRTHQLGGWSRMLVPGHCRCQPRHRGNAGFMVAILLSGLKYYHDVTGDPEVKDAIILGAYGLLDETYSEEKASFRYTSCPKMKYRLSPSPLMIEGIARAYRWTGDPRFRRVLIQALLSEADGKGYGKPFSMYYRAGPRVLADLQAGDFGLN